ncbi:MAG: DUF4389 domain-containing protein [Methylohalobius sp. ZOD2]|uniref:DUF4389 domain-containing protein n=1 Tax=Methylohalobius crimeensis TaxID=244365 RepID=UPI0003B4DFB8|nr:DUF4389 domain-containing protein [Methylohalobius crimeensis]
MHTSPIDSEIRRHLKEVNTWQRIFFMAVFAFILGFVRVILWAVVIFQVASKLLTGRDNPHARQLGATLGVYLYQILLFLTFNTDQMPFPFAELEGLGKLPSSMRR